MDLTKDWIEDQLLKLEMDLAQAERQKAVLKIHLDQAKNDYTEAREAVETTSGLIRYFRQELELARLTAAAKE
jgi:hypothetical protein